MKKRVFLIAVCCLIAQISIEAQGYRLSKLTYKHYHQRSQAGNPPKPYIDKTFDFLYTGELLTSINGEQVEYKKDKILLPTYKKYESYLYFVHMDEVKLTKEGKIEERNNVKLKFHKDGQLKELEEKSWKRKFDVLYDENNRLRVFSKDIKEFGHNYLLFYDESGKCTKAVSGLKHTPHMSCESMTATWDGDRLMSIANYSTGNMLPITRHDFVYDSAGNIIEEKIYSTDSDENEYLAIHYSAEYEHLKGNDDVAFFELRNWKVNLIFGQKSLHTFYYRGN